MVKKSGIVRVPTPSTVLPSLAESISALPLPADTPLVVEVDGVLAEILAKLEEIRILLEGGD